jgi:hypothetical protein
MNSYNEYDASKTPSDYKSSSDVGPMILFSVLIAGIATFAYKILTVSGAIQ